MTKLAQVYKCEICGNIVEVLHTGAGELVCCGQPMVLLEEKKSEEGVEKHLPVVEKSDGRVVVKVGSVAHPMEGNHYIEWIEVSAEGKILRQNLKPGDKPEVVFNVDDIEWVRSFCNIHGLWKA